MLPWALNPPSLLDGNAWVVGGGSSFALATPQHLVVMSSPVAAAHPRGVVDSVPAVLAQVAAEIGDSGVGEVQITGPACIYRLTEVMRVELRRDTRQTAAGAAATSDVLAAAGAAAASDGAVGGSPSAGDVLGGSPFSGTQPVVKLESSQQLVQVETAQSTAEAGQSGEEERHGKRLRSRHSDSDGSGRCICSGNCGSKVCKSNLNKKRHAPSIGVCTNTVMNCGGSYCEQCRCEALRCTAPKAPFHLGGGRWCSKHTNLFPDAEKAARPENYYLTCGGWQQHPRRRPI